MAKADIRDILHIGQVHKRDNRTASAQVTCSDLDGIVTGDMQVLFPASDHWNFFYCPKPFDHVAMLRYPNGTQEGAILGKVYTASNLPQRGADGVFSMVSSDGASVVHFNALAGTMTIIAKSGMTVKATNINLEAAEGVNVKAGGDVFIEGAASVNITATDGDVVFTGAEIHLNGEDG